MDEDEVIQEENLEQAMSETVGDAAVPNTRGFVEISGYPVTCVRATQAVLGPAVYASDRERSAVVAVDLTATQQLAHLIADHTTQDQSALGRAMTLAEAVAILEASEGYTTDDGTAARLATLAVQAGRMAFQAPEVRQGREPQRVEQAAPPFIPSAPPSDYADAYAGRSTENIHASARDYSTGEYDGAEMERHDNISIVAAVKDDVAGDAPEGVMQMLFRIIGTGFTTYTCQECGSDPRGYGRRPADQDINSNWELVIICTNCKQKVPCGTIAYGSAVDKWNMEQDRIKAGRGEPEYEDDGDEDEPEF